MMDLSLVTKTPACVQREIPGTEMEWTETSLQSQAICSNRASHGPITITAHQKTYG